MNQRLKTYAEVSQIMCNPNGELSDDGLFVDVSCTFQCKNLISKIEHVRGTFIPKQQGLFPGNGSSDKNTVWSALGISLKMWSQNICLEKAAEGCKGAQNIATAGIKGLESGAWKLDRFPGCSEKGMTISPFTDAAGSKRILHQITELSAVIENNSAGEKKIFLVEVPGLTINLPLANFNLGIEKPSFTQASCHKIIKGKLCFGDCIDLNSTSQDATETLGTPEPLGTEEVEMCADALITRLEKENLSPALRAQMCETYFWQSFLNLKYRMHRSCAALRGETNCDGF